MIYKKPKYTEHITDIKYSVLVYFDTVDYTVVQFVSDNLPQLIDVDWNLSHTGFSELVYVSSHVISPGVSYDKHVGNKYDERLIRFDFVISKDTLTTLNLSSVNSTIQKITMTVLGSLNSV